MMILRTSIGIMAAMALVGAALAGGPLTAEEMTAVEFSSPVAADAARQAILDSMRDPDSAKITDIKVYRGNAGAEFACGNVNAKNEFGGYTGLQAFHVRLKAKDGGGYEGFGALLSGTDIGSQIDFKDYFPRCLDKVRRMN